MLVINSILGNAYHGKHLDSKIHTAKENNTLKRLFLTRTQMEKSKRVGRNSRLESNRNLMQELIIQFKKIRERFDLLGDYL